MRKIFFHLFYIAFIVNYTVSAENIEINIEANKTDVIVNEWFQINLMITGEVNNVQLQTDNNTSSSITLKKSGVMSNISIINGVMASTLTYVYMCNISSPGTYEIGPFVFEIKGKDYSSKSIKINVVESVNNINNKNEQQNNQSDSYILQANATKSEAYENEFIDIDVNFYNKAEVGRYMYKPLSLFPTGSWIERLNIENSYKTKMIKNSNYNQKEFEKIRIFISKPGTYTIEPSSIKFEGFSSIDPYSSNIEIFTLKTEPIIIKINPLPGNSPNNFKDAVGYFKYNSKINMDKVDIKQPVTLNINLEGEGNFHNIKDFTYNIDKSFEVYPSKVILTEDNNKTYKEKAQEIIFVPTKAGSFKLKLDNFTYFDINQKKYITLNGNEFKIKVLKSKDSKNEKKNLEENIDINKDNEEVDNEEIDINNSLASLKQIKLTMGNQMNPKTYNFWYQFIIFLYIIIILSFIVFILIKLIITNDKLNNLIFLRKKASKEFNSQLNSLENKIDGITFQQGIDIIYNSIEKYFILKFKIDSIKFTDKGIQEKLGEHISFDDISILKDIISKINMARFASTDLSKIEYRDLIKQIKNFIRKIEVKFK